MLLEVVEEGLQARFCQADDCVRGAVVHVQGVSVVAEHPSAREYDIGYVPAALVAFVGTEDPFVSPSEHLGGVIPFEQREP